MSTYREIMRDAERSCIDIKALARKLNQRIKRESWHEAMALVTLLELEIRKRIERK